MEKKPRQQPLMLVPVFMAIGMGIAVYLVLVKLKGLYLIDYESACKVSETVSCDAVQASDQSTVLGIPIAIWAIPTYFVMMLLSWFGMQTEDEEQTARAVVSTNVLALLGTVSMVYSAYLAYIQATVVGATCPFCYGMYGAQLATTIAAFYASPDSFSDALGGGLKALLGGDAPLAAMAGTFGIVAAAGIVWFHHEDQVQYHNGSQAAVSAAKQFLGEGNCDQAQIVISKLSERTDAYGEQAKALLPRVIQCSLANAGLPIPAGTPNMNPPAAIQGTEAQVIAAAGGTTQPTQGSGAVQKPAVAAKPTVAKPTVAPKPTPAKPVAKPVAAPVVKPSASVVDHNNIDWSTVTCSGTKTDNGYPQCNFPVTTDDFIYGNPDAAVTLIEFADFECGYCRMLSSNLSKVKPRFKDNVRFVFKMYPMDSPCNPRMRGEKMHPEGCITAKAAYCAGKQGKFWEAHDKLFAMQKKNQVENLRGYMEALGVNGDQWQACFDSDAPQKRLDTDIKMAAKAWIWGTPRMYICGKLITGAASPSVIEYYLNYFLKNPQLCGGGAAGGAVAAAEPVKAVQPNDANLSPMVEVKTSSGSVFMDRFEASIDKNGKANSIYGVKPTRASWFQAKAACETAGKRLCEEEEWISACTGEPAVDNNKNGWFNDDDIEGTMYPYGLFYEAGACHDTQKTLEGDPVKTGSKAKCASGGKNPGVFDLTGNIAEWIGNDAKKYSQIGGNFGSGEGAKCNRRGTMFGPGIRNNTTGFRCCADKMIANATTDPADLVTLDDTLIGRELPAMSLKTTDDQTVDNKWFQGKVSYLTFFASWCGSCKRELPELKLWQEEMGGKGFQVLAVGADRYSKQSTDFIEKHVPGVNYAVALDPESKAMTEFDVSAMPTSIIVDKKGIVRRVIVGFKKEEVPEVKGFINKLLQGG